MRRYLSTLACSGFLGIVAFYGVPAFAGSIPGPSPEIAATAALQSAVMLRYPGDAGGSMQLVRGGGGGGGGGGRGGGGGGDREGGGGGSHGMGGGGSHGMNGHGMNGHGMNGFHGDRHFAHGDRFRNNTGGGTFFGFGQCNPYYGPCYPGY